MAFDPGYRSTVEETVTVTQVDDGVDDYSTVAYGAIDESVTNWDGILWGAPPKWRAIDLATVSWMRTPAGVSDAAYDGGGIDSAPGPRYRGALDLAPGHYDVTFDATWTMLTDPRDAATSGQWSPRTTTVAAGNRWESTVNPLDGSRAINLPADASPSWEVFEGSAVRHFDLTVVTTLWNSIGILGPATWGRILHNSHACVLTIVRAADPPLPANLSVGEMRSGRLLRGVPTR